MTEFTRNQIAEFVRNVHKRGSELYRSFEWRDTHDSYAILVSEVMLQQTQTARVERYFETWMKRFPSIDALASASKADVLEEWQGLGYNRRALLLKSLAEQVAECCSGELPSVFEELVALPGVGPATAAGVLAFAHNEPSAYLETNVRTVVLHELFPEHAEVNDKQVMAVVRAAAQEADLQGIEARTWNYCLLDYGVWLKKAFPNPSRRSKHHTKQSKFEGSHRQKRAAILREVLSNPGLNPEALERILPWGIVDFEPALTDLLSEGFLVCDERGDYFIAP